MLGGDKGVGSTKMGYIICTSLVGEEMGVPEMLVEESGPVVYNDAEEEEEGGLGDADMEKLAYEGDPLLYSDYEDEGI